MAAAARYERRIRAAPRFPSAPHALLRSRDPAARGRLERRARVRARHDRVRCRPGAARRCHGPARPADRDRRRPLRPAARARGGCRCRGADACVDRAERRSCDAAGSDAGASSDRGTARACGPPSPHRRVWTRLPPRREQELAHPALAHRRAALPASRRCHSPRHRRRRGRRLLPSARRTGRTPARGRRLRRVGGLGRRRAGARGHRAGRADHRTQASASGHVSDESLRDARRRARRAGSLDRRGAGDGHRPADGLVQDVLLRHGGSDHEPAARGHVPRRHARAAGRHVLAQLGHRRANGRARASAPLR